MKKTLQLILVACVLFTSCKRYTTEDLELDMQNAKNGEFTVINNFVKQLDKNYYDSASNIKDAANLYTEIINDSILNIEKEIDKDIPYNIRKFDDKIFGNFIYTHDYFRDPNKDNLSSSVQYNYLTNTTYVTYVLNVTGIYEHFNINNISISVNDTIIINKDIDIKVDRLSRGMLGDYYSETITFESLDGLGKQLNDNLSPNMVYKLSGSKYTDTRTFSEREANALLEIKEIYLLLQKKVRLVEMINIIDEHMKKFKR